MQKKIITTLTAVSILLLSAEVLAQSKAYSRKKPAETSATPAATTTPPAGATTNTASKDAKPATPAKDSDKLDIQELEQKYWAPKDTDFSVVQNRTYTKAKRWAASLLTGPLVNDPFNAGFNYALSANYYFDERYGVELMFQKSDLTDSDATKDFRKSVGGGVRPDFNRDLGFYGIGFNYVPFYAKMSFLGKKIIYFDMQITPFIGMSSFEQQSQVKTPEESAFSYGFDITQYFFFSQNLAVRANLHNRFYTADVLAYTNGSVPAGEVVRSNESTNTTMFLLGLTFFY